MRMRAIPRGLMVMGVVVATAAAVSAFQDTKSEPSRCTVCTTHMECPVKEGVKFEILDLWNGSAFLATVSDPSKVADFHTGWERCKVEMDKAMKLSRTEATSHLCEMCQGWWALSRQGARFECVKTESGVLGFMTSTKPKVVKAIREQAAREREMMTKKEPCCASP